MSQKRPNPLPPLQAMLPVTEPLFQQTLAWYFSYAKSYFSDDANCQEHILLKQKHSLRVAALIGVLARELGLSDEERVLAKLIGLLHDIARFEQYTRYQSFHDKVSFDHGEVGAKLLCEVGPLQGLDNDLREILSCAILHHNKIDIPTTLSKRETLHTRLVRDADKLDIIYLTCSYLKNGSRFPTVFPAGAGQVSPEIVHALARRQLVEYGMVRSLGDFHLLKAGWVYDLNFTPSLDILHRRGHLSLLKAALPASTEIEEIFNQIQHYIQERLG
nr:HD domain-containing protein [uncultured Desulfobulbus sp.]